MLSFIIFSLVIETWKNVLSGVVLHMKAKLLDALPMLQIEDAVVPDMF